MPAAGALLVDLGDDDLGALGEEPLRVREADALPRTGDDRDLVLQTSHDVVPLLLLESGDQVEAFGHDRRAVAARRSTASPSRRRSCRAVSVSFS